MVVGWVGGVKLKLKLNSAQLKLEFGLSLAIQTQMCKVMNRVLNLICCHLELRLILHFWMDHGDRWKLLFVDKLVEMRQ